MSFIRWFLETQLIPEKIRVWEALFMNIITFVFVYVVVHLSLTGVEISEEIKIFTAGCIGHYFGSKQKK